MSRAELKLVSMQDGAISESGLKHDGSSLSKL